VAQLPGKDHVGSGPQQPILACGPTPPNDFRQNAQAAAPRRYCGGGSAYARRNFVILQGS
jgi:hypothetical protein